MQIFFSLAMYYWDWKYSSERAGMTRDTPVSCPSLSLQGCTWGPGRGTDILGLWSVHSACAHLIVTDSLWSPGLQPSRFLCPWESPGNNIGVGCHFLLQGIFPTQGSNWHLLCLLCCRWILYHRATGKFPSMGLWTSPKMVAHHKDPWLCA